jgi:tetratricopeptide (TPR) repeat protein
MKRLILLILPMLLFTASILLAQPAVSDATGQLLSAAQALARDGKADIADVAAAYDKVFRTADLPAEQRLQAHLDLARAYAAKGQYDTAAGEYDRGATVAGLTIAQQLKALNAKAKMWFDSNFRGAFASYFTHGIEQAAAVYGQIIVLPDCPNADRIAAYQGLSNCKLELMDVSAANEALDAALRLPNLTESELFTAKKNKADALYRELDYDAALALYRSLWSDKLPVNTRTPIENRIVETLVELERADEARQALIAWNRPALALANFYLDHGNAEEARTSYEEVLADGQNSFQDRLEAIEKVLQIHVANRNLPDFFAEADRRIPALIAEDEKARAIYPRLTGWNFSRHGVTNNPDYMMWLAKKVLSNPKVSAGDFVKHSETLFDAHLRRQEYAEAGAVARKILAGEINTPTRLRYRLSLAVLDARGKAAGIAGKIDGILDEEGVAKNDPKARAEALLLAAKTAMTARDEQVARTLFAVRAKMLVPEERRSLPCAFLENGPRDITEFMQSAYFKEPKQRGLLDRKYGDNLQFLLETDAALTGRSVTGQQADFTPTEFVATCDTEGVKLFFFAPTTKEKARDIADGLAGMGGYEMYLAAGMDEPYHCYLVDVPAGMNDDFPTQYDNANFRRARQQKNTAKIEQKVLDNGVAMLLSVSWEAFFDKLPEDGDAWDFEAIHWEQGGYSWGGSKSVHNRSSFGSLVFANMTPDNRRAIKRRLIAAAAGVYRRELSPNNGYVEIWQDPELGDQQFFFDVIQPLQTRLSGYLEKVKPGMTAADVDLLYAEAVPQWTNIKYLVAALRRDYLDARRVEGQ